GRARRRYAAPARTVAASHDVGRFARQHARARQVARRPRVEAGALTHSQVEKPLLGAKMTPGGCMRRTALAAALVVFGAACSSQSGAPSAEMPPSCRGLAATCGADGAQSCCASALVPGGMFLRGYDGVTYADGTNPATVSDFRLDTYEITVGRF